VRRVRGIEYDKGAGIAGPAILVRQRSEGADAQIVRSVFGLDAPAAEKIAVRARAEREQLGRLTGDAAGEEMDREEEQVVLLDDIKRVFSGAAGMHLVDIVSGLAQLRPAAWGSLDVNALGKRLVWRFEEEPDPEGTRKVPAG